MAAYVVASKISKKRWTVKEETVEGERGDKRKEMGRQTSFKESAFSTTSPQLCFSKDIQDNQDKRMADGMPVFVKILHDMVECSVLSHEWTMQKNILLAKPSKTILNILAKEIWRSSIRAIVI